MSARVEKGKRWFKFVLLLVGITAGIKALFALGHPNMANRLAEAFVQFLGGAVVFGGPAFLLGWLAGKEETSKADNASSSSVSTEIPVCSGVSSPAQTRPGATRFDENSAHSRALKQAESSTITSKSSSASGLEPISNLAEECWAEALAEYDGNKRRPGLWARVFSEAQGNEAIAKANYLRYRADELLRNHEEQLLAQEQERRQANEQASLARLSEEQRTYELLPKGSCPNCKSTIPLASTECPNCGALFAGDGWKVLPIDSPAP